MAVTTRDIAKIAGVNQSTVSRCLNDSPLVSEETKARVKGIAESLGFAFNAHARSLSTNRTQTIGVIFPQHYTQLDLDDNLYFNALSDQLHLRLEAEEFDLITAFPVNRTNNKSNIEKLIACRKVDGLLLVQPQLDPRTLEILKNAEIPFAFLHHYPELCEKEEVDVFYADNAYGGWMATRHLLEQGHEKILCITAGEGEREFGLRTDGYVKALQEAGLSPDPELVLRGDHSFESGYALVYRHWPQFQKAGAVFAQTDLMAMGVIQALREKRVGVPEDMAIVGYNDIPLSRSLKPHLTTVHQPLEEIIEMACKNLLDRIRGEGGKHVKACIRPQLVVRDSSIVEKKS
ncbi:LacI family DNA-binding transcriptional regulator [Anaerotalea alkaliphila]|uniref:LacI family transcriptional regulator n=1 Tax=Anaerotalea alkaliphila TaxID=2662126 RepID=A0A7X5HXF9_9FIRM|nr:LacI family DNA-binding transcriptional regulator [Anaerotalea alkaliphila]NDL68276.1 LacI family transcriptional regulator [Anaerotalea alkaliphila]